MKKNHISQLIMICFLLAITFQINAQDWDPIASPLNGESNQDFYGQAVSMNPDGTIMAVGAPKSTNTGLVYVYTLQNDEWMLMGNPINGEINGEDFGRALNVSMNGETVIVGAPDAGGGHARVYEWSGSDWVQKGSTLNGTNADDFYGYDVDINGDGTVIIIGAPKNDSNDFNAGITEVYEWNGADWALRGSSLEGTEEHEEFGQTVGISDDGNTIVVGSPYGFNIYAPGITRVYEWSGSSWVQKGVDLIGEGNLDHSSTSLDISGSGLTIAIGSFNNSHDNIFNAGHVRVYDWSGSVWTQRGMDIDGDISYDNSSIGLSLSSDGNTVASGAPWNDHIGDKSGQVKVYRWNGTEWVQVGTDIYGAGTNDQLGRAVSLSEDGTKMAIGIPDYDNQQGQVLSYSLSVGSAIYTLDESISVEAFPNPTNGLLQVRLGDWYESISITIYNSMGQKIASHHIEQTDQFNIEMPNLAGFYFVELNTNERNEAVLKVLKN